MLVLFANSNMLFAINYFTLFSIYHIHGMIYRVLSVPCVYVSCYYRNVQGPHGADDFGAYAPTSAVHSPGTGLMPPAPLHTTAPVVGEWRGRDKTYFDYASLIDSDSFQVSCRFPDRVTAFLSSSSIEKLQMQGGSRSCHGTGDSYATELPFLFCYQIHVM